MPGSNSSPPAAGVPLPDEPLGLTVHSLPLPQEAAMQDARRTRSGRWKMLAVLLVCAAPVIASYFSYYVLQLHGQAGFGQLIDPQRPMPEVSGTTLDGRPVPLANLRHQWLLVSVAGGACDATCEKHLYLQRQLREGLGKNKDRLDWVWLVSDAAPVPQRLVAAAQQATVLRVDPEVLAKWLQPEPGRRMQDHLYVVDPLGHWMMRFPAAVEIDTAKKVRQDLERLMRGSASWDQAGRPGT